MPGGGCRKFLAIQAIVRGVMAPYSPQNLPLDSGRGTQAFLSETGTTPFVLRPVAPIWAAQLQP